VKKNAKITNIRSNITYILYIYSTILKDFFFSWYKNLNNWETTSLNFELDTSAKNIYVYTVTLYCKKLVLIWKTVWIFPGQSTPVIRKIASIRKYSF